MKIEVYSPTIKRKEMDAVLTAMVEDKIGPGEHTEFLIQTAKADLGFDYCLALRSPAFALQFALEALSRRYLTTDHTDGGEGGEGGDEGDSENTAPDSHFRRGVIVSALAPRYYDRVIRGMGFVPVYCDTGADSPLIAREKVEALMTSGLEDKPFCMIFRESLGYMADISYAAALGLPVIVDASESVGSVLEGRKAGGTSAYSEDGKPLATVPAGGGAALTFIGLEERDMITAGGGALLFASTRRDSAPLRALGELPPEYTLPDVNAAMAAVQFREAAKNLAKRAEIADAYLKASMQNRHKRFVQSDNFIYNNFAFSMILESGAKDVKAYAKKKEITVEEAFESTLAGSGTIPSAQCPNASSLALRTLLFPLYPRLGASAAAKVAKLITTLP